MKLKIVFLLLALGAWDYKAVMTMTIICLRAHGTEKRIYRKVSVCQQRKVGNKRQLLHSGIPSTELRNLSLVYSERSMANDRDRPPLSGSAGSCEECIRKQ